MPTSRSYRDHVSKWAFVVDHNTPTACRATGNLHLSSWESGSTIKSCVEGINKRAARILSCTSRTCTFELGTIFMASTTRTDWATGHDVRGFLDRKPLLRCYNTILVGLACKTWLGLPRQMIHHDAEKDAPRVMATVVVSTGAAILITDRHPVAPTHIHCMAP